MKNLFKITLVLSALLFLTSCSISMYDFNQKKELSKEEETYYRDLIVSADNYSDVAEIFNKNAFSEEFLQEIATSNSLNAKLGLLSSDSCTSNIFIQICQDKEVINFFFDGSGRKEFLYEKASSLTLSEEEQKALLDINIHEITTGVLDNDCSSMNILIYALEHDYLDLTDPNIKEAVYQRIIDNADKLTIEDKNALLALNVPSINSALLKISKK